MYVTWVPSARVIVIDLLGSNDCTVPETVVVVSVVRSPLGLVRVSSVVRFTLPLGVTLVVVTRLTTVAPSSPGSVYSVTVRPTWTSVGTVRLGISVYETSPLSRERITITLMMTGLISVRVVVVSVDV
jgi:hypothetical protein